MRKIICLTLIGLAIIGGAVYVGVYFYNQQQEQVELRKKRQELVEKQAQEEREMQSMIKQSIYYECKQALLNSGIAYAAPTYSGQMRWVVPNGRTINQVCDCVYMAYNRNNNVDLATTIYQCAM